MKRPQPNALMKFTYNNQDVRVFHSVDTGEPWWVAREICMLLGLTNTTRALQALDADEKIERPIPAVGLNSSQSASRMVRTWLVCESGVWGLILRSRRPEADSLRRWLRCEVLPSLRKHGFYVVGAPPGASDQLSALGDLTAEVMKTVGGVRAEVDKTLLEIRKDTAASLAVQHGAIEEITGSITNHDLRIMDLFDANEMTFKVLNHLKASHAKYRTKLETLTGAYNASIDTLESYEQALDKQEARIAALELAEAGRQVLTAHVTLRRWLEASKVAYRPIELRGLGSALAHYCRVNGIEFTPADRLGDPGRYPPEAMVAFFKDYARKPSKKKKLDPPQKT